VYGGIKVIVDEAVGAWMQRQIPRLTALAGYFHVRHTFARVPKISGLELAQFLTPQRVEQQRGENGTVTLALERVARWSVEELAGLMIANRGRLENPASVRTSTANIRIKISSSATRTVFGPASITR